MRALLKNGKWVDIDTNCLFNDQYNTTEEYGNKRIFDGEILLIQDDARIGKGRCKYCGKLVNYGEEEKHFEERENKNCNGCFWYRKQYDFSKREKSVETSVENGIETRYSVEKTPFIMVCSHKDKYGCCEKYECRNRGIDWFTPENTFFLKYPNGFDLRRWEISENEKAKWDINHNARRATYKHNIGSYVLSFTFNNCSGYDGNIDMIYLRNGNGNYVFNIDSKTGDWIVYDGIKMSPRTRKHMLDYRYKVSADVEKKVRRVIDSIMVSVE